MKKLIKTFEQFIFEAEAVKAEDLNTVVLASCALVNNTAPTNRQVRLNGFIAEAFLILFINSN